METIKSACCEFAVEKLPASFGYCYVCRTVHEHEHLDLRLLKEQLLARVGEPHRINWGELCRDSEKVASIRNRDFCQSLLTDLFALCLHGKPLSYRDQPLQLHTCYKGGSVSSGLDFTTDLCTKKRPETSNGTTTIADDLKDAVDSERGEFKEGQVLRYEPSSVEFVAVGS